LLENGMVALVAILNLLLLTTGERLVI